MLQPRIHTKSSTLILFSILMISKSTGSKKSINVAKDRDTGPMAEWANTTDDVLNYEDPDLDSNKIVCSQQQFTSLFDCCKKEREIFFTERAVSRCNKGNSSFLNNFLTDYVLNKYQSTDKNAINLKSPTIRNALGPIMCFVECIFRNEKLVCIFQSIYMREVSNIFKLFLQIFRSKTINYDKLMNRFISAVKSVAPRRMEEIINNCRLNVEDLPLTSIKAPVNKCLIRPLMLMQCLRKEFLFECPRNLTVKSVPCNQAKLNLRHCEIV
ncbi:uncharacterized protein LOC132201672 isoform X2 [Neocloeon triangulifer]|uniref:uncharacterized protein LOC132201672 isoform X2 n=1 Tax=Neocloeon triangulifer TaxID=2078957 RepID=UPI00286EF467|nr:uncharacterized protein LOC132201672 isoform X2 [Neocloeon triangulifer]